MLRSLILFLVFQFSALSAEEAHRTDLPVVESSARPAGGTPVDLINAHVNKVLGDKGISKTPSASPQTFLRRSFLDFLGRPPNREEFEEFQNLPLQEMQPKLCDYLMDHEDYAKYWSALWKYWLFLSTRDAAPFIDGDRYDFGDLKADLYSDFNQSGHRIDHTVWKLLTDILGKRGSFMANYMGDVRQKVDERKQFPDFHPLTDKVSRTFLGTQLSCVQCHDEHYDGPLKQSQYWNLNAFYKDLYATDDEGRSSKLLQALPSEVPPIEFADPKGKTQRPTPILRGNPGTSESPLHEQLAQFILDSEQFPVTIVNRYWNHLFGYGLNYPASYDHIDLNDSTNPYLPLLKDLGSEFKKRNFKPRDLLKWICKSEPYARDSALRNGEISEYNHFARMAAKPVTEEQMAFSAANLTGYGRRLFQKQDKTIYETPQSQIDRLLRHFIDPVRKDAEYRVGENRLNLTQSIQQQLAFRNGELISQSILNPITDELMGFSFMKQLDDNGPWRPNNYSSTPPPHSEALSDEARIKLVFNRLLARNPTQSETTLAMNGLRQARSAHSGAVLGGRAEYAKRLIVLMQLGSGVISGGKLIPPQGGISPQLLFDTMSPDVTPLARFSERYSNAFDKMIEEFSKLDPKKLSGDFEKVTQYVLQSLYGAEVGPSVYARLPYQLKDHFVRYELRDSPEYRAMNDIVWAIFNSSEFITIP